MLRLSNITKSFDTGTALNDVSLTVGEGEFFAVLGPSGSGKTSLLNVVAGLINPDAGLVEINSVNVTQTPPNKRNIGMVFQNFFVYPHLNVYENIRYPLRYASTYRKADIPAKVREVAELLKIGHLLDRKSFELSGGEKQRVALARAIIKSPTLFLLDEPLSSLDYQLRLQIRSELKSLHGTLNKTFIQVTHDQAEAFYLADRVAIMDHGKIVQVGCPKEILDTPKSLFVAKFIHSYYNEVSCTVSLKGNDPYVSICSEDIRVDNIATKAELLHAHGEIRAFIRSQDINLPGKATENNLLCLDTRVIDALYVSDLHLIELENGLKMASFSSELKRGAEVKICIEKKRVLLYDHQRLLGTLD